MKSIFRLMFVSLATVVGACGPEPDSTRTSAGGGSAAPANSALPRARPPAHRAARPALMGAVL